VAARARDVADRLRQTGLGRGDVVAVIGGNCASYIVTWMAAQFAGVQTALINPAYPDGFLGEMLDDLAPAALIWVRRPPGALADRDLLQLDLSDAWDGRVECLRGARRPGQIAAWIAL
jgi:acyl-CoA synthetase (AMP-forming)/AMP-acid ligase II